MQQKGETFTLTDISEFYNKYKCKIEVKILNNVCYDGKLLTRRQILNGSNILLRGHH